jgi:glycosyltransferase involved in cell wall biosynthesis
MGLARYWVSLRRERRFRQATPHVAFISRRDRAVVLGHASRATVVPNGVDSDYWARRHAEPEGDYLLFTGVMDYRPNEDAALFLVERLLPEIRRAAPHVKVMIAGRNPSPVLLRAASRADGVTVTGFVDDLRPYMERALMFLAPMRIASGMQNKLLEAMAMELSVVTTEVAADGLRVEGEGDPPVVVADSPQGCADAVVRMLRDRAARRRMGTAGRAYVLSHFNWERSAAILETMCLEAAMHPTAVRTGEGAAAAFGTRRPGEVSQGAPR